MATIQRDQPLRGACLGRETSKLLKDQEHHRMSQCMHAAGILVGKGVLTLRVSMLPSQYCAIDCISLRGPRPQFPSAFTKDPIQTQPWPLTQPRPRSNAALAPARNMCRHRARHAGFIGAFSVPQPPKPSYGRRSRTLWTTYTPTLRIKWCLPPL